MIARSLSVFIPIIIVAHFYDISMSGFYALGEKMPTDRT